MRHALPIIAVFFILGPQTQPKNFTPIPVQQNCTVDRACVDACAARRRQNCWDECKRCQ